MSCNTGLRLASQNVSRAASVASRFKSRWGTRSLHRRKALPYPIEGGLGEFLPPSALKAVAVEYQDGLLQRLNDEVRGTADENATLVDTIINAAPRRKDALTFNYASLALNNGYFLSQLKPPPPSPLVTHQTEIAPELAEALKLQHGSIAQLKSAFSAAATGMFTNGYVWFVTDANGNTGIIPTFGAGTLLIRSRSYMGHAKDLELGPDLAQFDRGDPYNFSERGERPGEGLHDVEGNEGPFAPAEFGPDDVVPPPPASSTAQLPLPGVFPQSSISGATGTTAQPPSENVQQQWSTHAGPAVGRERESFEPSGLLDGDAPSRTRPRPKTDLLHLGEVLYPLFCVSVHEHAWMAAGYGVWGKENWLKKFWTVLDWQKVSQSYNAIIYQRNTN